MKYAAIEEIPVDTQTGVISDSVIRLTGPKTSKWYPDTLRMVVYEDYATGYVYRFLTNDFTHSYLTIAELYRERWQVECLFKMDKTATTHQVVLRYEPKCCILADLDSHLRLSVACHCQEGVSCRSRSLHSISCYRESPL